MLKSLSLLCSYLVLSFVFSFTLISCGENGTGNSSGNQESSSSSQETSSSGIGVSSSNAQATSSSKTILSSSLVESSSSSTASVSSITSSSSSTMMSSSAADLSSSSSDQPSSSSSGTLQYGTMVDHRDNKSYETIIIGTQVWMAENLNYETATGSYCYDDDPVNCDIYGRLYTWEAAMAGAESSDSAGPGSQGICPADWHVPSDGEWTVLADYVSVNAVATSTDYVGRYLKASSGWIYGDNGTDVFGFSALPGGHRGDHSNFYLQGSNSLMWSATEYSSENAWYRRLSHNHDYLLRYDFTKNYGLSLRCLHD